MFCFCRHCPVRQSPPSLHNESSMRSLLVRQIPSRKDGLCSLSFPNMLYKKPFISLTLPYYRCPSFSLQSNTSNAPVSKLGVTPLCPSQTRARETSENHLTLLFSSSFRKNRGTFRPSKNGAVRGHSSQNRRELSPILHR